MNISIVLVEPEHEVNVGHIARLMKNFGLSELLLINPKFDLEKAKKYSAGLALEKINDEIRLTSGLMIDASTRKPRVHYRLLEKKEGGRRASFLYEGTVRAEDAPEFTRRWLIVARKEGDQWRVSNFTEYD